MEAAEGIGEYPTCRGKNAKRTFGPQDPPGCGNYLPVLREGERRPGDDEERRMISPPIDWNAALAQHDRWLRTIVLARVRERQAVDEVIQEVALAAVRQSAPLLDVAKVAPWLYRLAVRQSLLHRRKCGRKRKLEANYAGNGMPLPAEAADPLSWLICQERRSLIRQALGRLAPRDREILLLKYTEGWNYHQIATHVGVSHSAIEARLHRARQRLREELAAVEVLDVT
jgi:RNA polymerase sigma factor (sigma-70 family)